MPPELDRWYVPGTLGIGTAFDEPAEATTGLTIGAIGVGSAVRHDGWETLNLLDGRTAAVGQGPNLNWWGLNAGTPPKAVRLGAISSRFASTADGRSAGFMSFFTKPASGGVVEALRITEAGNVGIGTATPSQRLEVNGGAVVRGLAELAGGAVIRGAVNGGAVIGGVSVGTDVPGIDYQYEYETIGVANKAFNLRLQSPNSVLIHTAGVERLSIDSAGNVGIRPGTLIVGQGGNGSLKVRHIDGKSWQNDSDDHLYLNWGTGKWVVVSRPDLPSKLQVFGDIEVAQRLYVGGEMFLRSARTSIVGFDGGGRQGYHWVRTDGDESELWFSYCQPWPNRTDMPRRMEVVVPLWAPTFKQHSDARRKEDVRELGDVLSKLASVRGVSFRLRTPQGGESATRDIGVIAQEVEAVFPELVAGDGETHDKAVSYSGLVGVLVEAVKALDNRCRALEQQHRACGANA